MFQPLSVQGANSKKLRAFGPVREKGPGPPCTPTAPNFGRRVFLPLAKSLATASLDEATRFPARLTLLAGVDADIAAAAGTER
jgi:hypothetical protein